MTEATHGGRRDGAGPKQKYNEPTVQTAIRLPASMVEWITAEAARRRSSRSDVIVDLLQAECDRG